MKSSKNISTCVVCGDKAFYCNYGALTCDGCKKFFRVNSLQQTKLVCLKKNTCKITRETRTKCRACRFEACLNAGMVFSTYRRENHEDIVPPKKKKSKISSGMDLINILLEAQGTTPIAYTDNSCKKTKSGLQNTEEMGEKGRIWAARFVRRILESCGEHSERTVAEHEQAVLDIMTMRLATSFVPELKGFLFQSGSLVSLSDIAKRLKRKLCRRLFFMSSLLICMSIDYHEVALLCGILATLPRPSLCSERASPLLDDFCRSHITTLHQYELNKRSWNSNMSFKMLQSLLNVHEISIKKDCGLFVLPRLQQGTGVTPSPEAANILAMELLQGLVSCETSTRNEMVLKNIPSSVLGSSSNSSTYFQPHQEDNSSDVSKDVEYSYNNLEDRYLGRLNISFHKDIHNLLQNNVSSSRVNYISYQEPCLNSENTITSYNEQTPFYHSAENYSMHSCTPSGMQYYPLNDLFSAIYSSCKQELSQLEQSSIQSCNSDVQNWETLQSDPNNNVNKISDSKPSYTSFMIGQHPAFKSDN